MMRYETHTVRIGENVGPVDWDHPMAKDMPSIWREAEANPSDFTFGEYERSIISICMYDGWPYWTPTPAICFYGPIGPEWSYFNSYGVSQRSIKRRPASVGTHPEGQDGEAGLVRSMGDAVGAAETPKPCTCHPDDRPNGPCREKYAASECQAHPSPITPNGA